jgi:hypothetical protein
VNVAICQRAQSQPSNIPNWYGYYCLRPEGDIDCLWIDRTKLEDAATVAAEDKKWAALSIELNEQFDRGQKSYAALEQSVFRIFNTQEMSLFWSRCRQ